MRDRGREATGDEDWRDMKMERGERLVRGMERANIKW